jgi:23S rRNA (cytosine1962-C5)-methyltransferase
MFGSDEYQLLDFGGGRKLERFGRYLIDRPAPAAVSASRRNPDLWEGADARFEREAAQRGRWVFARHMAAAWPIQFGPMMLELKFTEHGQVGLFPEQARNWDWIAERILAAGRPLSVLNLFAYTGGSTLAAAAVGAEVTHVDSATTVVTWARRNVAASHMEDAPIRWIAEDVLKFARRELKRGHFYDAVILDPPSYGHGPKGEPWKLGEQLGELLDVCWKLTARGRSFLLLTCHSGELAVAEGLLKSAITQAPQLRQEGRIEASDMFLASVGGGRLHAGASVRWSAAEGAAPVRSAAGRASGNR